MFRDVEKERKKEKKREREKKREVKVVFLYFFVK